jgi:6-phosphogluconolactonase (cycloisomerase 2 family)
MMMQKTERSRLVVLALASAALAACANDREPTQPQSSPSTGSASRGVQDGNDREGLDATGAVYLETNDAAGNAILAFSRAADGSLAPLGTVPTGGRGAGGTTDPLQSQYAAVLRGDHRVLYAVNAGSNDVSSFTVADDGSLILTDRAPSGGVRPVSLASRENLLYVLNNTSNTVQGYRATRSGTLSPIPQANASLLPGASGASTIHFSADGAYLIVTERNSNRIETFAVRENGRLGAPVATPSHGAVPFALDNAFDGSALVAEAGGAAPNGAVSSYQVAADGALQTETGSLSTQNPATCWIIATSDGHFAYAINAGSGTISGFAVGNGGSLTLLDANGITASTGTGSTPLDPAVAGGNRFLYVFKAGTGTVEGFRITASHGLAALGDAPAGAPRSGQQGLAAY